ncbi:hypothetical protein QUF80_15975 [Desulfococcaceae bacterium HSG8]|nr:hypothetical protein [Desulfococcaceae bacterium HSG8]
MMQKGFRYIIRLAKETPSVSPPDDFTVRVMAQLPELKPERSIIGKDCAFCFLAAACFYFITGIVFIAGVRKISTVTVLPHWIMVQPQIAFITGSGFILLGISLLKNSRFALRTARIGLVIYIGFVLINGITAHKAFGAVLPGAAGIFCFTGSGIMTGGFLALMLRRYREQLVNSGAPFIKAEN